MLSVVLALTLQATAPVQSMTAQNAKPPTPPPEAEADPDGDGIICWKEAVLGSRLKRRACTRVEQVEERRNDDRDLLDKAQKLQTVIGR